MWKLMDPLRKRLRRLSRFGRTPTDRDVPSIVRQVRDQGLTYLEESALLDLHELAHQIESEGVEGDFIEAGCALGGSAIVLATAKGAARRLYVYDVFGMIPPPSDEDEADVHERYAVIRSGESEGIGKDEYYGYRDDLLTEVVENFRRNGIEPDTNGVEFVKGLFQDTLRVSTPVALAHIDGDWYESVMTCLERIEPRLSPGGVLVIDDYDAWSGCRKAVDTYFAERRSDFDFVHRSRLQITRR